MNGEVIQKICIDVDQKRGSFIKMVRDNIKNYPNKKLTWEKETKKGYHFFIILKRRVTVWDSFDIRLKIGDDPRRLAMDMLRWNKHHDLSILDICFDKKVIINETVMV